MRCKCYWKMKLATIYKKYKFMHGYKLVFGKWKTLAGPDTAFLTPHPGLSVPKGILRKFKKKMIAERKGNSYRLDLEDANSPINGQFMGLTELIQRKPDNILAGVATPFRTGSWDDFNPVQQHESRNFGLKFWNKPLHEPTLRLIIVSGEFTFGMIKEIMDLNVEPLIVEAGWGNTQLKRFEIENGPTIVHLPYLGQYQLLSNEGCIGQLQLIFEGILD